ncbi:MAG: hypothetical protein HKP58_02585 [Desulfatitalea sp.]|nr:hypothetical protein [Desulfatitalea sp.]
MQDILPPQVQWNEKRGKQAADVPLRLLRHRREMAAVFAKLDTDPRVSDCLDLPYMHRIWNEMRRSLTVRVSRQAETALLRGVMCGLFLNRNQHPTTISRTEHAKEESGDVPASLSGASL